MSVRYKIAIWFAVLVTAILAMVGFSIYFFSKTERSDTFKNRLFNRAGSHARIYAGVNNGNYSVLARLDTATVASLYYKSISIIGRDGGYYYSYADKPGDSLVIDSHIRERVIIEGTYYFNYNQKKGVAIKYSDDSHNFIVAVAAEDIDGQEFLQQLKGILIWAPLLAGLLSFLTGLVFARNIIKPVTRITREVNLITSNNISRRIEETGAKDELNKLAGTFNHLLDRLQESFSIQRRFISNASHELSTPLTSISNQLEVALQRQRTYEEYRGVLISVYEDVKELHQLTRSLLEIAKTGSQGSIDLEEVRLDEVLLRVIADVQKQNNTYKVLLDFNDFPEEENQLTTFGNVNLLYIALKNIIENGCKYAVDNQSSVLASFLPAKIIIQVANKGDIISESDIQNIFQPFFRADDVKSKPGFGLGLTLARRILSLHNGTIAVTSDPETGTVFAIELPRFLAPYK